MQKEIICTVCPVGCVITVVENGEDLTITGNKCNRGITYASAEFKNPVRILTTTIKVNNSIHPLVPVRSSEPLPKDKIIECMNVIRTTSVSQPVHREDVLIKNILETGVDIVATGEVLR